MFAQFRELLDDLSHLLSPFCILMCPHHDLAKHGDYDLVLLLLVVVSIEVSLHQEPTYFDRESWPWSRTLTSQVGQTTVVHKGIVAHNPSVLSCMQLSHCVAPHTHPTVWLSQIQVWILNHQKTPSANQMPRLPKSGTPC